jgi:hypothetical protein
MQKEEFIIFLYSMNPNYCMAIKPVCDKCKQELTDYGGILFSPPNKENMVRKWHICKKCYAEMIKEF